MTVDPRAALDRLVGALEAHLAAAQQRRGEMDPHVERAYHVVAEAFTEYDEALFDAYSEVTPLVLYDDVEDQHEDDDLDDLDEDDDDEDDDEDDDDLDEDEDDVEEDDVLDDDELDDEPDDDDELADDDELDDEDGSRADVPGGRQDQAPETSSRA
ncbi:DNA primase [Kineosporiaceae bacterium SCSIO 59966]|nr:DNA primase [Kineosporiaceae bacterium SCSIO 59966]